MYSACGLETESLIRGTTGALRCRENADLARLLRSLATARMGLERKPQRGPVITGPRGLAEVCLSLLWSRGVSAGPSVAPSGFSSWQVACEEGSSGRR